MAGSRSAGNCYSGRETDQAEAKQHKQSVTLGASHVGSPYDLSTVSVTSWRPDDVLGRHV